MSESRDDDHSHSLSLDIPSRIPSSSPSSPLSPCRTHSPSTTDRVATAETTPESSSIMAASTSSLPSLPALAVKFAPLPEMAPRKRRSGIPLGMAARAHLVRRRNSSQYEATPSDSSANSGATWGGEELDKQRRQQEAIAMRRAHAQASIAAAAARQSELEDEEDEAHYSGDDPGVSSHWHGRYASPNYHYSGRRSEDDDHTVDPILALGRIVKGAGKTLWKRMASKDLAVVRAKYRKNEDTQERRPEGDEEDKRVSGSASVDVPLRPILATITSYVNEPSEAKEEGHTWGEEIGDAFPLNVGQTETIIEGRAVYPRSPTSPESEPPIPPTKVASPLILTKVPKSPPLRKKSVHGKS